MDLPHVFSLPLARGADLPGQADPTGAVSAGCLRERCRVVKAGKIRRRPSNRNERADAVVRRRRRSGHLDAAARNDPSEWNEALPLGMAVRQQRRIGPTAQTGRFVIAAGTKSLCRVGVAS